MRTKKYIQFKEIFNIVNLLICVAAILDLGGPNLICRICFLPKYNNEKFNI